MERNSGREVSRRITGSGMNDATPSDPETIQKVRTMPPTTLSDTTVKKTDLEKNKALKLIHNMKRTALPAQAGDKPVDRREQRRIDQAQGLVPFAVKLNGELVKALQGEAEARQVSMNALVGELLEKALKS